MTRLNLKQNMANSGIKCKRSIKLTFSLHHVDYTLGTLRRYKSSEIVKTQQQILKIFREVFMAFGRLFTLSNRNIL